VLEAISGDLMPTNPRSHFGILSADILPASELLPLIDTMTFDEQIIVIGKLRSLEVVLLERIIHEDLWHPHHGIVSALKERTDDELLDAKEASRRMGYSTRWLYNNADSLPFTIRQKSGRLRFSRHGLDEYVRSHRKRG
jgi:predicted DNA-binding transcriptional regulator AlpA